MNLRQKKASVGRAYLGYLFSYIIVLMIPIIILTAFYSSRFMKKFYEEIYETVDLELAQLGTQMEHQWVSMQNIADQLTMTKAVHQAAAADSPLDLAPLITTLSSFCCANPFIQDIALVLDEQEYIAASSTTCRKDYYFDRILQSKGDRQIFTETLLHSPGPVCLPSQPMVYLDLGTEPENLLLFSFPVFTDYQDRAGSLLFFVRESSFQSLLNEKLSTYQAQIYIRNQAGDVILTSGPNPGALRDTAGRYIMRSHEAEGGYWSYYAFLPNSQDTFAQVSAIMRDFLLAMGLILCLSCFAIYILQKVNYAPVRRLRRRARELFPEETAPNEMTAISNALDRLSSQNTALSSQNTALSSRLERSLKDVKSQRLYRLLSGDYSSREDFNLDCAELDLQLSGDCFVVCILMLHSPSDVPDSLALEVKRKLEIPCAYYLLHNFRPDQIILLMNTPGADSSPDAALLKIQHFLREEHGISSTAGIGSPTCRTDQIGQSYMEAASALDYRFVKGNGTLIHFQEVLGSIQANTAYPHREFEALKNALAAYNEDAVRASVEGIIQFMEANPIPLYLARSICYDLIHLINAHSGGSQKSSAHSPIELSGMETAQEIICLLRSWSMRLKDLADTNSRRPSPREVSAYVRANCLRCDFSAYETAEHFGMSLPTFSKFFKDTAGQNVMDYAIHIRMEKAKELLSSTSLPLKDIGEQVGYYNISSFTRRFKLHTGLTPGEYRRHAAKA